MSTPIATPLSQRLADFRRGPLTVVVWLAAVATVALLLRQRSVRVEHDGLARVTEYEISAAAGGRIEAIAVDVFEEVTAGQVLAVLDGSQTAARIATASAELARLQSALEAEASRATSAGASVAGELRSFHVDEERLRLQTLSLKVELESDRVEKARLDQRLAREEKLAREGLAPQGDVDDARLSRDAISARIVENEALLAKTLQDHRQAARRREAFSARYADLEPDDPVLTPLRQAVKVQERRIEEIELERRALLLRSPIDGRISEVRTQQGQAVLAGEPLLLVAPVMATEVMAYVPEAVARTARPGAPVRVASATAMVESVVDRVGPAVKEIPRELWRNPALPEHGVPLLVKNVAVLGLLPGERVTVTIQGKAPRT